METSPGKPGTSWKDFPETLCPEHSSLTRPGPKRFNLVLRAICVKGELQRKNKLISYERVFKMLENDMNIAGIGQAVLELLTFKVGSGNHQRGISLLQTFSDIFRNMRLVPLKMTSHLTSHNFHILKIEIFSKLCKI